MQHDNWIKKSIQKTLKHLRWSFLSERAGTRLPFSQETPSQILIRTASTDYFEHIVCLVGYVFDIVHFGNLVSAGDKNAKYCLQKQLSGI